MVTLILDPIDDGPWSMEGSAREYVTTLRSKMIHTRIVATAFAVMAMSPTYTHAWWEVFKDLPQPQIGKREEQAFGCDVELSMSFPFFRNRATMECKLASGRCVGNEDVRIGDTLIVINDDNFLFNHSSARREG